VLMPSFTFVSTASAVVMRGAVPVFVDVRPDTLNLDHEALERAVTERTRAVVPVHYAGVGCEMDTVMELARAHELAVIEDAAQGIGAAYRGRPLGSFGQVASISFHETKNVTSGEGGALLVNEEAWVERAEVLQEKGTNRSRFFRGEVDKYTWLDVGSSYVLSDMLAAFLFAQLEQRQAIQVARRRVWQRYRDGLSAWAQRRGVELPFVPPDRLSSHHLFHLLLPSGEERAAFIAHMRARGVSAIFHYLPLHLSPMGERFGGRRGQCPVAETVSERVVRLPLFASLSDSEQGRVIDAACSF
jgi:dTDP-4-amino-4,6-dideoxygalactose transaminase